MQLRRIQQVWLLSLAASFVAFPLCAQQRQTILGRKEAEKKTVVKKDTTKRDTLAPSPTKNGTAEITGLVLDSLHGTYLRHADVMIEGAQATTVTDSLGRFKVTGNSAKLHSIASCREALWRINKSAQPPSSRTVLGAGVPNSCSSRMRMSCR